MTKIDRLYSAVEVSKILGVSRSTLRTLVEEGELRATRIGNRNKFSSSQIEEFLSDREVDNR